jgi:TPP-dependent pyruvate/acetoin dehydrogenase alpha subunit
MSTTARKQSSAPPDAATLERILYYMKLTREAEYRIERVLYRQGKILGGVYVGRGQEAISVASAIQLVEGDVITPTHRDFAAFVIRGMPLRKIFCNWLGRADGPTRGRDGGPHMGDMKFGIIALISSVGSWCLTACGAAMALQRRGERNVALTYFGEGTSSRGDIHEAMNWAAVMKLPVIFICNNNAFAYSTPAEKQYAVKSLAVRGPAYGMPGVSVDGNDVLAVYAATREAITRARAGQGPSLIECRTFRMTGHSAHDAAEYVPERLKHQWAKKDPIARLEKLLVARGLMTHPRLKEMEAGIQKELEEAITQAEANPLPDEADAVKGVYCQEDCWWKRGNLAIE